MDLNVVMKDLRRVLYKNSPTILTALGVGGLITTVILAVKATPKALEIIEMETEYRSTEEHDSNYMKRIETLDVIELTWKEYIPTIAMGAITIACIIGSNRIHMRRNAALASLFAIAETSLKEYQARVAEKFGEKKEEMIRGELAQEKLDKNPVDEKIVVLTGKGQYLCYDSFSGQYFKSDIEALHRAENVFNQRLLREGWLCINSFYDEIGLEPIALGDEMGWIAEKSLLEMRFNTKLAKDEPCLVIDYMISPIHI